MTHLVASLSWKYERMLLVFKAGSACQLTVTYTYDENQKKNHQYKQPVPYKSTKEGKETDKRYALM